MFPTTVHPIAFILGGCITEDLRICSDELFRLTFLEKAKKPVEVESPHSSRCSSFRPTVLDICMHKFKQSVTTLHRKP